MLYLILPVSFEKLKELQHTFATEKGIWFGNPQVTAHPHQSIVEWYVGDYLLNLGDEELRSFSTSYSVVRPKLINMRAY